RGYAICTNGVTRSDLTSPFVSWGNAASSTPVSGHRHGVAQGSRRRDVDDELFARVQRHYDDDTIAELTMIIAWENASSRFNRATRVTE
ncbi:MAG TPA: hypothetical protein VML54_06780, partial [Candidatus Limnocylindrales bacterium]|nr:hypothetical protein [Candidatus Limnocylindrales bacterium]